MEDNLRWKTIPTPTATKDFSLQSHGSCNAIPQEFNNEYKNCTTMHDPLPPSVNSPWKKLNDPNFKFRTTTGIQIELMTVVAVALRMMILMMMMMMMILMITMMIEMMMMILQGGSAIERWFGCSRHRCFPAEAL